MVESVYININNIKDLLAALDHTRMLAVTAPFAFDDSIIIGLCLDSGERFSVHVLMEEARTVGELIYAPHDYTLAVHGLKRIWENHGEAYQCVEPARLYDVKLMGYLIDPGGDQFHAYSLARLTKDYLKEDYPFTAPDICDRGNPEALYWLLAQDASLILRLARTLSESMSVAQWNLYREVEIPVMDLLYRMHRDGIGVDGEAAQEMFQRAMRRGNDLLQEITGGETIDLNSGREVYRLLKSRGVQFFESVVTEREDIPEDILTQMTHLPIVVKILEWRQLKREDLSFLVHAAGRDRIHPIWRQTMGSTGRIFSSVVPVQYIDKRKYRPLLRAAPGNVLLKADYSAFQLRLLAHLSGDETLLDVFCRGEDVHQKTADWLKLSGSPEERRNKAKAINFGICFGQGARSLSADLGITPEEAQSHIDAFFKMYSGAQEFFEDTVMGLKKKSRRTRVITSPFGRARQFPHRFVPREERKARVTLLQMLEADIAKRAMVRIDRTFREMGLQSRIVMMIHDSIWVEAPEAEQETARTVMEEAMTTVVDLSVPLEIRFE